MKKLLALALLALATGAHALPSFTGKVDSYLTGFNYQGKVYIEASNYSDNTGCRNEGAVFDFAFDGTTDQGKMYLSILMAAHTAQKTVVITGFDTCDNEPGIADLRSIQVKN